MSTTVYLIRHGETDWNVEGRWQGHADVPLNELGRAQARLLGQRLATDHTRFDAIYSSDLARAYQTAWEVGAALQVPVQLLPPLREIDLGTWSGMTYQEIKAQYPVETTLLEAGQDIPRGGAESMTMLQRRVVEAVDAIVALHKGETLCLVTHGGCVRALLAHAASFHGDTWEVFPHIGNTSISIIRCSSGDWSVVEVNDMRHLDGQQKPDLVTAPPDDAEPPQGWNP